MRGKLLAPASGLAAAWLAFCLLVWVYGEAPRQMLATLAGGTWGTAYGAGQVLFKATPLLFTGIAVDLALRAGLFNIGAEGQLAVASLFTAVVGSHLPPGLPAYVAVPVAMAAAAAAGAAWASVPALLRARFGAHEVISTIMMNRIADCAVGLALGYGLAQAGTVRTADVSPSARLPRLESVAGLSAFRGSAASVALVLAVVAAFLAMGWLRRSRVGREIILVGLNPVACASERTPVERRLAQALVLSGAVAGLAAAGTVLGYKGYYEIGLGAGDGFGGIAVALLGRGSAVGLVLAALFFGTLQQGGLAINAHVPMEVMQVLEGVVIAAVALADARVRAALARGFGPSGRKPAVPRAEVAS
jgi:general nucleoside transport system permease protein